MITTKAPKLDFGPLSPQSEHRSTPQPAVSSSHTFRASRGCRKCVISCSIEQQSGWKNPKIYFAGKGRKRGRGGEEGEEDGGGEAAERKVHCEVETVSWRERRIKAEVVVNAGVEKVWNAVTDYERLADYIPNLIYSGRIPCPYPGRIWLEQRGLQRALYWHIEARVVLDLQEIFNSISVLISVFVFSGLFFQIKPGDRELHFSMVDGDFKKFEGKWCVKLGKRPASTILSYEVSVIPRFSFPAIFLERIIGSDLPVNLLALARRAEKSNEDILKMPFLESAMARTSLAVLPTPAINTDDTLEDTLSFGDFKESYASPNFGLSPSSTEPNNKWSIFGRICRLDRPCMVDEVHLRRFDGLLENGGVHRCVVASITVKAPVREVWNVMTAYERLPEIVPNLAISKVLFRDNNRVRILQEGCKGLLYMVLHARVVLDLCEQLEEEISFEQVEGDFDSFQGKWVFEQLGNQHTLLKYTVESKMHKDSFLSEAIMEEVQQFLQ
uniref:Coenzyme Q-binding protein COQ10 START domain-containing protein n=1 Tax=Kalanchoe fedtschenkoi TaxID=63787 RepID=A0A7N0RD58_KALFE